MSPAALRDFNKINNFCLVTLTAIALTGALIYTRPVMVPFVFSLFIYVIAAPVIGWMQNNLRIHRLLAVALTLILIILVSAILFFFVAMSLDEFIKGAALYKARLIDLIGTFIDIFASMGFEIRGEEVRKEIANLPVLSMAKNLTGRVISFVTNSVLVLIFVMFLLLGGSTQRLRNILVDEIQLKISKYIVTKSFMSLITGVLVGLLLMGFGVELAFMFAVLTILLNFIPSIGSIIATLLPLPIILLQFGFDWRTTTILLLSGVIQFTIGNIVEPKVMGENMGLHPVAVLAFLIFWGLVWGVPGMFLAVPITAIVRIILSRIPTTQGVAEILAGRIPGSM